jgi:Flp pilus assembly protein TadD
VGPAREAYERALAQAPSLTSTLLRLQDLYAREGRPESIVPFLERGLAAHPDNDLYHHLLGRLSRARGDLDSALRSFRRAVEIQPENGLYLGDLAVAAAARGEVGEARRALEWAERWQPREAAAWIAIGSAWDRLGETARSIDAFRRALDLAGDDPTPHLGIALAEMRRGRVDEASRVVREARRRFPADERLLALERRLAGPG